MRAEARKNCAHLLAVARAVITEHGADASLRDIARKADVRLATLYRHFPTRKALLEALLHATLAELTQKAGELETSSTPDEALVSWFRERVIRKKLQRHGGFDGGRSSRTRTPLSMLRT